MANTHRSVVFCTRCSLHSRALPRHMPGYMQRERLCATLAPEQHTPAGKCLPIGRSSRFVTAQRPECQLPRDPIEAACDPSIKQANSR